jgi:predicted dehydrogenase
MSLKVAVIGCGKIADGHIEEIGKIEGADVVAVCDLEPLMAEQIAVRYGIPAHYSDFARMLQCEKPDVVHITTPPQFHLPLARIAVDAGCHLYMEKPLAPTAAEARKLIDYVQSHGRKMTINYWPNFDPPGLILRDLLDEGVLGDPVHVESFFGYNLSSPFGQALLCDTRHWVHGLPGKLFQNVLDHLLNKIALVLPDDAPRIVAQGYRLRPDSNVAAQDCMLDELRIMMHGERVSAYGTFSSHARPVGQFLRVYGSRNTVHVDYNLRTVVLDPDQTLPSAIGRLLPPFQQGWRMIRIGRSNVRRFLHNEFHYFAGMNRLITAFYGSIREDGPLPISYRDILRVSEWMDEIFRQVPQPSETVQSGGAQ